MTTRVTANAAILLAVMLAHGAHAQELTPAGQAILQRELAREVPAAQALSIHVSTLRYRAARLKELLAIGLGDAGSRLALGLKAIGS